MLPSGPPDVSYRRAVPADAEEIRHFTLGRHIPHYAQGAELCVTHEVPVWLVSGDAIVLVAERAGVIVGVLCMHLDPEAPGIAEIDVLAVLPEHRRLYIGANLKARALATAKTYERLNIRSSVDIDNGPMRGCNRLFAAVTMPSPHDDTDLVTIVTVDPEDPSDPYGGLALWI